eukprot:CAMPEP_0178608504 /NCGR_PEP_ID=MMETSP0697-20121206/38167_1 /TAXON_ID=265572 /ORGANISM="Extubocellulus spinifer, Strain CCMP396" /LENGTH=73 /DNA_ID=CAMNT_0020247055 /DNA_START=186 /DNA_END=407 /DNA_ORIENTATION=-
MAELSLNQRPGRKKQTKIASEAMSQTKPPSRPDPESSEGVLSVIALLLQARPSCVAAFSLQMLVTALSMIHQM